MLSLLYQGRLYFECEHHPKNKIMFFVFNFVIKNFDSSHELFWRTRDLELASGKKVRVKYAFINE